MNNQAAAHRAIAQLIKLLDHNSVEVRERAIAELGSSGEASAVQPLIKLIKDTRVINSRLAAAKALVDIGEPAREPLSAMLTDEDKGISLIAALALAHLGDARAAEPLADMIAAIEHDEPIMLGDYGVYTNLLGFPEQALVSLGEVAIPILIKMLIDDSHSVRAIAVRGLSRVGTAESVTAQLVQLMEHQDYRVRYHAALTLAQLGNPLALPVLAATPRWKNGQIAHELMSTLGQMGTVAIPLLGQWLRDEHREVRRQAADALGEISGDEAFGLLLDALQDGDNLVQRSATLALGRFGERAVPYLAKIAQSATRVVQESAIEALGDTGSAATIPTLLLAFNDSELWDAAATALGKLGEAALDPLITLLQKREAKIRYYVIGALGQIGSPAVIPTLLPMLQDKDRRVRGKTCEVLGRLGSAEVIPLLQPLLRDQEGWIRAAAALAIARLDPEQWAAMLLLGLNDPDSEIRYQIAGETYNHFLNHAHVTCQNASADRQLVVALTSLLRDEDVEVRLIAIHALKNAADPFAIPKLAWVAEHDNEANWEGRSIREAALAAIACAQATLDISEAKAER